MKYSSRRIFVNYYTSSLSFYSWFPVTWMLSQEKYISLHFISLFISLSKARESAESPLHIYSDECKSCSIYNYCRKVYVNMLPIKNGAGGRGEGWLRLWVAHVPRHFVVWDQDSSLPLPSLLYFSRKLWMCKGKESYKLDQDRKEFSSLEAEGGKRVGWEGVEALKEWKSPSSTTIPCQGRLWDEEGCRERVQCRKISFPERI